MDTLLLATVVVRTVTTISLNLATEKTAIAVSNKMDRASMDLAAASLENNVAVSYLEHGDLKKALDLFRSALRRTMGDTRPGPPPLLPPPMVAAPLPDAPDNSNGHPDNTGGAASSISGSVYGGEETSSTNTAAAAAAPRAKAPEFNNSATPFIHAQGFGVVGTPGAYSPDPLINTTVVSTLVIFNLALVYHVKGIHEKALNEARLYKAHSLYIKAHLLLVDAGVSYGSTGNAVVDLLSMAVCNNLAHVCYELSRYEESRAHFDSLIRFALSVIPQRYGDRYVGSVMDQQKSNFLLNAIILHAPSLAPAA